MFTNTSHRGALAALCLAAALGCGPAASSNLPDEEGQAASLLTNDQKRARCDTIKAQAAPRGIINPLVFAGIAHHESGLAQCYSEATWTCPGPASSDCGGGAVLAGAYDGACSAQEGGIGMFQLDSGTYSQTLSAYGSGILTVAGNTTAGINVIIQKVRYCDNTPNFGSDAEVIAWINTARPGTANYDTFMHAMASCYNGCRPEYTSCSHDAVKNAYQSATQALLDAFGSDYWYGTPATPALPTPALAANADGRLEVFMRGSDGAIYHDWQVSPGGGWSGWYSLGGSLAGSPAVGHNADGRLSVFARGPSGDLWVINQTAANGSWGGWGGLGGTTAFDPAVGANADGRLMLAVRGGDGAAYARTQACASCSFDAWQVLGGSMAGRPALENRQDGGLEAFGRAASGEPVHAWQNSPNGSWSGWYGFAGTSKTDPVAKRGADGRVYLFIRGGSDHLFYVRQSAPNSGWDGWVDLGGGITSEPAVGVNTDGSLVVLARGNDNGVWYRRLGASGWSAWATLGGAITSNPAVGRNADGRLVVVARGGSGVMYLIAQQSPSSDLWSSWQVLSDTANRF